MNSTNTLIDAVRRVETPEGVELNLPVAGLTPRALAASVDLAIRAGLLLALGFTLSLLGSFGIGLWLITFFALEWFYPVLFEMLRNGQTPGKKMFGLAVVLDDGTPIDWSRSCIRNFLRTADLLPFLYAGGMFCMLLNRDFKRLGDYAAGSLVIHQHQDQSSPRLPAGRVRAPAKPLSVTTQAALIEFALRHERTSLARQAELASIIEPLVSSNAQRQQADYQAVDAALSTARWSAGHAAVDDTVYETTAKPS